VSCELHDLIQRAYRTRQTRARIIVEECLERLPHYRGPPDSLREEIRRSTLHHLALLYRVTLETGRQLAPEDLEFSRQLAEKRAAQGVPLGEFLTFFLVGLTRAWEHLIASAGDDPRLRDQLLERVAAVISNQTQLMTALTEAYVEERERRSRFREQDLDDFVHLLLAEEAVQSVLEARARTLGIALDEPRTIAIFGLPVPIGNEGTSVGPDDVRRSLAAGIPAANIWVGRSREGFVALLPEGPEPRALAAAAEGLFGEDGRVGVGSPGRDVDGLRRSAREALRALRIGMVLGGSEPVQVYANVAVLDLVGIDSARAEEFMRDVLGPLIATGVSPTYLETLRQLSANNYIIKLAAAALSVHPHTLSYRVRQIRQRFGFDLDDPEVRLRVQLALRILDARGPAFEVRRPRDSPD
jgi:sugar diacid utilization regulator